jgi:alpha-L-arabinofuranosidase
MWAERVQDRSFEGVLQPVQVFPPGQTWTHPRWKSFAAAQPQFDHWPDQPAELEMVTAEAAFELDQNHPFIGRQSAKVSVDGAHNVPNAPGRDATAPSFVAGIAQDDIAVKQGEKLNVEIFLRGDGTADETVTVLLGCNYGVFFRAYAQLEFTGVTGEWRKFSGVLTPTVTDAHATLAIGLSRPGAFWVGKVSLMPQDNECGWRRDVVEAVRALKPGIIRFGGSSLIYYDWRIGVGPRDQRAPFENHPWGNMEENDVGLHEFLQFCELVGAEPLICLNANSATVEQIIEEIEYCNGPADSRWGRVRAEMGHPAPFNVRYWQLGNEQAGEEYERRMVEYAQAIRSRHLDLRLLASYPSDTILRDLSTEVDYVCPHIYAPYGPAVEVELQGLIDKIRYHVANKEMKIAVTEWNHTAGHWGWARSWLLTLFNALNAARMFNLYQRHGDWVRIANRSNMTNSCNSGTIQTSPTGLYVTPTYHVQKAYAQFTGDCALRVVVDEGEALDVAATQRQLDGEIALFVVNATNEVQSREIDFRTHGSHRPVKSHASRWMLAGPSLDAVNSFCEPVNVAPKESVVDLDGGRLDHAFPPYSVTVLRM